MKYIITFLFLCASTVFGAVPSFQAFDANFFQITGTGNNSIKIKTNNFTWGGISGGSGDSVWTNSAGVIQPNGVGLNTNLISIAPSGAIGIGGTAVFSSPGVRMFIDAEATPYNSAEFNLGVADYSGPGVEAVGILSSTTQGGGSAESYAEVTGDGYTTFNHIGFSATPTTMKVEASTDALTLLSLEPTAADGTTPYTFDTSVFHSDAAGNLFEIRNSTTNKVRIAHNGQIFVGPFAREEFGVGSGEGFTEFRDVLREGITRAGLNFEVVNDFDTYDYDSYGTHNGTVSGATVLGRLYSNADGPVLKGRFRVDTTGGDGREVKVVGSTDLGTAFHFWPTIAATLTPYVFDTATNHTSGNLFEVKNLGTNKFSVAWDGTVNIDQANIGSATFTNVYFLNPIIASNGVASYAANAPVAITASGWTNSYSVNAIAEIDAAAADLKYFIKNSAGTGVYTNLASSTVWHATAILQPGGAVVITAGTTPSGTARPF